MNNTPLVRLRSLQVGLCSLQVGLRSLQVQLYALRARLNTVDLSRSLSGVNCSLSGVEANNGLRLRSANDPSGGNPAFLHGSPASQSGVVLVISLIILLLLTLIGVSATQTTSVEEKMTGNLRDKNLAFQAAESALRAAENSLNPPPVFTAAGTGGFYLDNNLATPNPIPTASAILTSSFWTTNPVATSTVTTAMLGNSIAPPVYIIQKLLAVCFNLPCPPNPVSTPYKITVRATGASVNTVVILQSIYTPP